MPEQRPKVFILEDEPAVAIVLEDMVSESGCDPAHSAGNLRDAQRVIDRGGFDCALIDINVGGERSFDLARQLVARGTPFAFVTGYDASVVSEFGKVPCCRSPIPSSRCKACSAGWWGRSDRRPGWLASCNRAACPAGRHTGRALARVVRG